MAEANRRSRPLSPHLTIYRPQITSVLSILTRVTGVGLMLGSALGVWWFLAAATGPDAFAFIDGLLTSWIGGFVMLVSMVALWYHCCNGVRHLVWDAGFGYELPVMRKSAVAVGVGTAVLSLLTLFAL